MIYQILGVCFEDDCVDELIQDSAFIIVLEREAFVLQSILSKFLNRLDEDTFCQCYNMMRKLHKVVHAIKKT